MHFVTVVLHSSARLEYRDRDETKEANTIHPGAFCNCGAAFVRYNKLHMACAASKHLLDQVFKIIWRAAPCL